MFSRDKAPKSGRASASEPPSIISANLEIVGDLCTDGDIQVDGTVRGDISSGRITVGRTGRVCGEISADEVSIDGRVEGQIRARSVTLGKTAQVHGDVFNDSLCIAQGARLEGLCRRLESSPAALAEALIAGPTETAGHGVDAATVEAGDDHVVGEPTRVRAYV